MCSTGKMPVDYGYAWVVLGCSFMMRTLVAGFYSSLGIIMLQLEGHFGVSASDTATYASIVMLMLYALSPISSAVAHRFSYRLVVIGAGIIVFISVFAMSLAGEFWQICVLFFTLGVGLSFTYQPACTCFLPFFNKRYALANGIHASGTSVGFTVFPPLLEFLISKYGWQGGLQILSAILANICVCGFLLRTFTNTNCTNEAKNMTKYQKITFEEYTKSKSCRFNILRIIGNYFDFSLFRNVHFLFQGVLTGILFGFYSALVVYLYPYCVSVGISEMKSSLLMSVNGFSHLISRLAPLGYLIDKKVITASTLSGVSFMVCGLVTFLTSYVSAIKSLIALFAILGVSAGIGGSYTMVVVVNSAGSKEKGPGATSWMLLHCGIGSLIGIYTCGYLFDVFNSYQLSLGVCGICLGCLGINIMSDPLCERIQSKIDKQRERKQSDAVAVHV